MNATPDLACACTALRKATRAVSRFYDEALAPTGLSTTQFAVLRHVLRLAEPQLSRLAEALVMDRTSLYRTLTPMTRQGWLEIVPAGGRAKAVRLTDGGRAALEAATPAWLMAQQQFLARFGDGWPDMDGGLRRTVDLFGAEVS